ncbi:hypothetical protein N7457_002274 [Penicillium paradoxum]|uniref:uncharacterized protein n=1 Tax=Penicillium paradoxum TaxID=176176 RepID=UPI0025478DED|nr:uncharacterized protein N7457_002274 [Penicillium paradoxum]KAJ5787284.1 hypothetical protein N7457_002274 [Penicillium paradoxum]
MAEVIGVVSGALTFATVIVQIGKSITVIKDYWEEFRDAPADLQRLVEEIKVFGLILANIDEDLSQPSVSSALEKSKHAPHILELCKKAAEELDLVCKDLSQDVGSSSNCVRRTRKALRVMTSKGKIEKNKTRLQNAVQWLMLSQQTYTIAFLQIQPQLIAEKIAQRELYFSASTQLQTHTATQESCVNYTPIGTARTKAWTSVQNRGKYWRLTLPSWITSKVLEVGGMRVPDGWNWVLRTYNIIPYASEVVFLIRKGDIKGLQDLFASRQASVFDLVYGHIGLLQYTNRVDVLEFLLGQGADPATVRTGLIVDFNLEGRFQSSIPYMRVLFRHLHITYDSTTEATNGLFRYFHGTPEDFLFLQRACFPSFYQLPLSDRIKMAIGIVGLSCFHPYMPDLFKTIIGKDVLEAKEIQLKFRSRRYPSTTIFHFVARNMGCEQEPPLPFGLKLPGTSMQTQCASWYQAKTSWWGLFQEYLHTGANIHDLVEGRTIFLSFLTGYDNHSSWLTSQRRRNDLGSATELWLKALQANGVDLKQFGRAELVIWRNENIRKEFVAHGCHDRLAKRIIGFTYGPSPEDWHLWVSEPTDRFAGEFWSLIERPVEVMPGTWPEQ